MNAQEIFNTSVSAIVKQGRPSVDRSGKCLYRGPRGRKCAVGWLIPDELYVPEMEDRCVETVLREWPAVAEALGADERCASVLDALQGSHDAAYTLADRSNFLPYFKKLCVEVAMRFGLDPAVAAA